MPYMPYSSFSRVHSRCRCAYYMGLHTSSEVNSTPRPLAQCLFWYKLNKERKIYFKGFKWKHRQTLNFIYVVLSELTDYKREKNFE